ncbi:hypothetical protein G6F46_006737 [Rhizopus delemar]|nr:hypothetical protein G6F49_007910 [Rhizopus delemar]KAG1585714.1 hypothetical protein G6F48_007086 [Rhizopus delemar]KAG1597540.1 hypothetical protein G6F47_007225 [Rhizopus delemar]KAG1614730.1 hypothetical protein G6F46_006737 [Rhizopus delemar]KAG1639491.1 hypothetical protein G6F44_007780 [Rhizopus delemar]
MAPKADWEKYEGNVEENEKKEKIVALDEGDIKLLTTYGQGPYTKELKTLEQDLKDIQKRVNEHIGVKESDTGLAAPNLWDIPADKQRMQEEQPLQVARCTKIIQGENNEDPKYVINVKQIAKFVVELVRHVSPTDIEEGMRVGVDRTKYQIQIPLPPKIDPSVTMMQVEEKPDVTYSDVGGCKEQIERLREVVELPLLQPERFVNLGIDPPKGVLLYGPPGTGKTLCARAVANRTDATFIRVIGSELVQKYVGEGARMVRELFEMARTKKACIIFFDEVDAIGGARFDDGAGGDNEVQRTMLELINQLDGFDPRGNIKVLMATNRPDTLDPALLRPGRLDRRVEFGLPDLEGRAHILKIHAKSMSVERDIRYELIARLCPNATGAELRSVCTEAGMFAIRSRRKVATEKDFLESVNKVIKGYQKFSNELNNAPPNSNGVKEEDLVLALKITARDIHRICGKLKEDRLIKMVNRMEPRKPDQRMVPKTYYYIDYKEFVDVVKWKMYKMQTLVRDKLRTESENKGYVCSNCAKTFTPLDVLSLVDMTDQLFHCDQCDTVLDENDNAENVKESQEVLTKLREQSQPIISLLKQTDSIVIPSSYIYKNVPGSRTNGSRADEYELAVAQDTGAGQGDIIVDLQMDNEAARRAKLEEAEQKRQQNALPVWHQKSTISDTILVGTGDRPVENEEQEDEDAFEEIGQANMDTDTEDYYAKYYENLSNNVAGQPEEILDEEQETFETVNASETAGTNGNSDAEEAFEEDIPLVYVSGRAIPLNEVTEEDQSNMTTDEYKAYYEAWENWQNS